MIELKRKKDLARLRRLALAAQGLLQAKPFGSGLSGARRAISHIGYVQIDSISVVERAHHHVLFSRVHNYKPAMINKLLLAGDIFEYWSHAAAFLPMTDFRFSLPYKHAIRNGQVHWYKNPDRKLMAELLARIRSEGPLRSRDLEADAPRRGEWWDWKPSKKALEQLFMEGKLMVSSREGFEKSYDLTERVLPSHVSTRMPSAREFAEHLLDRQLRCHALVSLKGLTYLRRSAELRGAMKALVEERVTEGALERICLRNGEVFVLKQGVLEQRLPRSVSRLSILSPFDNSVIQRDRLKALFHYDYQLECYLPKAKRQYGYFSLPLLYRDEFIGRMDCKAHRSRGELKIRNLHFEAHKYAREAIEPAFDQAIENYSRFLNCDSVAKYCKSHRPSA